MVRLGDRFSHTTDSCEPQGLDPHLNLDRKGAAGKVELGTTARKHAKLLNYITFQAGWFACVWGAGQGMVWLGPFFVAIVMAFQAGILTRMTRGQVYFILLGVSIGMSIDTGMILAGVYGPVRRIMPWPLAPVWIIALWVLFTSSFSLSLQALHSRPLLTCLLGAVAAPLSYAAGGSMGAASMNPSFLKSYLVFGIVWGLTVPALFALSSALLRAEGPRPTPSGESP
jgi:hypothetical protein